MIERQFYRLPELARRWGRGLDDLLHLGILDRIQVCVAFTGATGSTWEPLFVDSPEPDEGKPWKARILPPGLAQLSPWQLRQLDQPGAFPFPLEGVTLYRPEDECDQAPDGWYNLKFDAPFAVTPDHLCMTAGEVMRAERDVLRLTPAEPTVEKPLTTTERNTLLGIIAVMAVQGYGFDKSVGARLDKLGELLQDCERAGLTLSDDTLREKLRAAFALLRERAAGG